MIRYCWFSKLNQTWSKTNWNSKNLYTVYDNFIWISRCLVKIWFILSKINGTYKNLSDFLVETAEIFLLYLIYLPIWIGI